MNSVLNKILRISPVRLLALLGLYFVYMTVAIPMLAPAGRSDDAEILLLTQSFQMIYEPTNPPLFHWLVYVPFQVFGPGYVPIVALLAVWLAASAVAFVAKNYIDAARCNNCAPHLPMDDFAAQLRSAGYADGTILDLSILHRLPALALRTRFPQSRMIATQYPTFDPPAHTEDGDCLIIWNDDPEDATIQAFEAGGPVPMLGQYLPPNTIRGRLEGGLHLSGKPVSFTKFALVKGGLGTCR